MIVRCHPEQMIRQGAKVISSALRRCFEPNIFVSYQVCPDSGSSGTKTARLQGWSQAGLCHDYDPVVLGTKIHADAVVSGPRAPLVNASDECTSVVLAPETGPRLDAHPVVIEELSDPSVRS